MPAGFTITTDACRAYMAAGKQVPAGLDDEVGEHIAALEERSGKRFGDPSDPLLVSVRSGAAVSMPGMMDTILNLGLNDVAVEGQAAATGNRALRLRLVPAADPDVRGGRGRRRRAAVRGGDRRSQGGARGGERSRARRRRPPRADRHLPADLRGGGRLAASPRIRASSCAAPTGPSSTRGTRRGRRSIGARTRSRTTSARR